MSRRPKPATIGPNDSSTMPTKYTVSAFAVSSDTKSVTREIIRTSERWARERFTDLRYFNEPAKGGHFAAFEQPELFVDEVRAFFRLVR